MRRGASVKNEFAWSRSGKSDVASVSASASCRTSSPGLQNGQRVSRGLRIDVAARRVVELRQ